MTLSLHNLQAALTEALGEQVQLESHLGELTLTVKAADYLSVAKTLHDHPALVYPRPCKRITSPIGILCILVHSVISGYGTLAGQGVSPSVMRITTMGLNFST